VPPGVGGCQLDNTVLTSQYWQYTTDNTLLTIHCCLGVFLWCQLDKVGADAVALELADLQVPEGAAKEVLQVLRMKSLEELRGELHAPF